MFYGFMHYTEEAHQARVWRVNGEKRVGNREFPTAKQFMEWVDALCWVIDGYEYCSANEIDPGEYFERLSSV